MIRRFIRFLLAALGLCSGCSKSPVLTPSQFTQASAEAYRTSFQGLKVAVVRDLEFRVTWPDGREYPCFLYNAYDLYKQDPAAQADVIQRLVNGFAAIADAPDAIDRSRVVPVIKDRPWLEETRRALADRGAKEAPACVYDDFNRDLVILYAEDSENSMRYLRPEELDTAKIDRGELRALACANLERLLPKIEYHGSEGLYMLTAGGDYEASLLLLDSIWTSGQMDVQGDIVVAIPTRDLLLVTGSEYPEGLEKVRQMVRDAYDKGPYRLTPKLFVYRGGRFTEFDDGADSSLRP